MKKTPTPRGTIQAQAMKMIQDSGVLNLKMPLDEFMNLTHRVASMHPASSAKSLDEPTPGLVDYFIHKHFVLLDSR